MEEKVAGAALDSEAGLAEVEAAAAGLEMVGVAVDWACIARVVVVRMEQLLEAV